jgi:putative intracellular protease/amidase
MRKVYFIIVVASFISVACAFGQGSRRILVLVREVSEDMEFMIKNEVQPMIEQVKEAGYNVVIASESGKPITTKNQKLVPDVKLADAAILDYDGVIVPCMMAGSMPNKAPAAGVVLLREAAAAGLIIAAQHSIEMLVPAGLTKGRRFANSPGVVVDGKLITSWNCPYTALNNGKPVDTYALIEAFLKEISER